MGVWLPGFWNEKSDTVLLVAFGAKKEQQKIISHILQNKEKYRQIVEQG
jgi:hypothetical protein